jgi:hypothetical protein
MSKLNKYFLYILFGISIIIGVIFFFNTSSESMVYTLLNWSYILFFICLICTLIMPLFYSNGKSKKGAYIKVGIAAVLCLISYILASGSPIALAAGTPIPTESTLKFVDAGLILSCILGVVAFVSIFSRGIINLFRK